MSNLIEGWALALKHEEAIRSQISKIQPGIKVVSILIGDNPPSEMYTNLKQKKAQSLGIDFQVLRFSINEYYGNIVQAVKELNENPEINGIMVQLPIPEEFLKDKDWKELTHKISPAKDIDGLVPGSPFLPATAKAVLSILEDEGITIKDKRVVVVGRSDLIGKPVAEKLKKMGAEVEVVHRQTQDPQEICKNADILISAAGSPHLITKDWVKEGAVVIDVGTSELDGKIVGDVDFDDVSKIASKITPPKGGVGPMTVISLMENILDLC